jgi:hypothetical protein
LVAGFLVLVLEDGLESLLGVLDVGLEEATYSVSDLLVIKHRGVEFPAVLGGSEPAGKGCVKVLDLCGE